MIWMGQCCRTCCKKFCPSSVMEGLRSAWRRGGDPARLPKRDEHLSLAESLLAEVDFHIHEFERRSQQRRREEQKSRTGVDYSWLISETPKVYKLPQLERLELEELCLKLEASECSKVVSLFRDATLREPPVEELARIMRCCVIQVLEQRPRPRTLSVAGGLQPIQDWVNRRANSVISLNMKFKSPTRVGPAMDDNDIEMQSESLNHKTRAFSVPNFIVTASETSSANVRDSLPGSFAV